MTRVLIVDDEADLTRTLAQRFEACGDFRVETAFDGLSGLVKVRSFRPDVILVDVKMSGLGGWEFLRSLRGGPPETRDIPVLVLTADQSCAGNPQSKGGARHLIMKPFDVNELVSLVRREAQASRGGAP